MNKLNMFKTLAVVGSIWFLTFSAATACDKCGNPGCGATACQSGNCHSGGCSSCGQGCNSSCNDGCGHECGCGSKRSKNPLTRWWKKNKSRRSSRQCNGQCDSCYGNCDGHCHGNCDGNCDGQCDSCDSCNGSRKSRLAKLFRNPFCPSGSCNEGTPLFDKYHITYAAQPNYFDQRDGRLYSAQGYGVPMAVPLAPNVRHTYNYGWGMPSSRLTPVSRYIPDSRAPVRR